jgi:beta-phosphoglucomutase
MEFVGVKKYFSVVLSREQTENGTTGLKDYGLVMNILDKKSGECIVIEDSPVGVSAAKKAGLFCIAFERYKSEVLTRNADIIIHHYDELRKLFSL